jgi:hypothetical protein
MNDLTENLDTVIVRVGLGYCTYLLSKTGYQIYRGRLNSSTPAGCAAAGASAELSESAVVRSEQHILQENPTNGLLDESTLEYEIPKEQSKAMPRKKQSAVQPKYVPDDVACDVPEVQESSEAQPTTNSIGLSGSTQDIEPQVSVESVLMPGSGITIQTKIETDGESIDKLNGQCQRLCLKLRETIFPLHKQQSILIPASSTGQFPNQSTVRFFNL